jgi:molybdopterin/thiamine biosynthesis adenylyltransferase
MTLPLVVLPELYGEKLHKSRPGFGTLAIKWSPREGIAVVDGYREGRDGGGRLGQSEVPQRHHLANAVTDRSMGLWYRVEPDAHLFGVEAARRDARITIEGFREQVRASGWIAPRPGHLTLAVTVTTVPDADRPHFAAWTLSADGAEMCLVDVVPERYDLLDPLRDHWPLEVLTDKTILLVGTGSIGSVAAHALACNGARRLILVDPDRLLSHNFVRHACHPRELGRFKVNALHDQLHDRDPLCDVEPLVADVIYDANLIRSVLREVDAVVVATDGVASRRAANHLIRRAGKPAVFACVLENGAFGEVMRIRPPTVGCLLCARAELIESGGMNPEPRIDRGYGTGTRHLPMTAAPGDLALVGQLAAKATVATLLEPAGFREQRLPGDHAIIGLRPKPGIAQPFNLEQAGAVSWRDLPPPREDCPTCGA